MKRCIGWIMLLCLLTGLAACNQSQEQPFAQGTIGVVMPERADVFCQESIAHLRDICREQVTAAGHLYERYTSADAAEQRVYIDQLIAKNVDCIILWPQDEQRLKEDYKRILDAGIPLIIYNGSIADIQPNAQVIGDNEKIGKMAAQYMNQYFSSALSAGAVNILEFVGDDSSISQERSSAFTGAAHRNMNVLHQYTVHWQRQEAKEQMAAFLRDSSAEEIGSIQAVFTHDDEIALGVLDAIEQYAASAPLHIQLITGVGGSKASIDQYQTVKNQRGIDQVTYLYSPAMIRQAVEKGIDILNGKGVLKRQVIDTLQIDLSNLESYQQSDAYQLRYKSRP